MYSLNSQLFGSRDCVRVAMHQQVQLLKGKAALHS